jgi:hypothetical protein
MVKPLKNGCQTDWISNVSGIRMSSSIHIPTGKGERGREREKIELNTIEDRKLTDFLIH